MTRRFQRGLLAAVATAALAAVPHEAASPRHGTMTRQASKTPERARRGRPRKFGRPSRAQTLTLPEDVIASLEAIDRDLSQAVVRVTKAFAPEPPREAVEITTSGDRSVIVVPCNPLLEARTGVQLVPLADGGALISFDDRVTVSELELRVVDALGDPAVEGSDRQMFEALAEILRRARQADGLVLREHTILIVGRPPAVRSARERSRPGRRRRATVA